MKVPNILALKKLYLSEFLTTKSEAEDVKKLKIDVAFLLILAGEALSGKAF